MVLMRARLLLIAAFALGVILLPSASGVAAQAEARLERFESPVECFPLNPPFTGWQVCTWIKGFDHLTFTPRGNEIVVTKAYGCFEFKNPQGQVVESSCETDHEMIFFKPDNVLHVVRENIRQSNTFPGAICDVHWVLVRINLRPTADVQRVSCTPT
jgi:hypothetical protein